MWRANEEEVSVARGRSWMWRAGERSLLRVREGTASVVRRGGEEVSMVRRGEVIDARQGGGGECRAPGRTRSLSRAREDEVSVAHQGEGGECGAGEA